MHKRDRNVSFAHAIAVVVVTLTYRHNKMQSVAAGQGPITPGWKEYTHDNWSASTSFHTKIRSGARTRTYQVHAIRCTIRHRSQEDRCVGSWRGGGGDELFGGEGLLESTSSQGGTMHAYYGSHHAIRVVDRST